MSAVISEDVVSRIDVLECFADLYDVFDGHPGIIKELHKKFDDLRNLPSVTPKQWTGEWILCSDRLPDRDENVIATSKYGDVYMNCRLDEEGDDEVSWVYSDIDDDYPVAWIPMPEPYKAERRTDE